MQMLSVSAKVVMDMEETVTVVRVDRAGMDDERVVTGEGALDPTDEYLSLVQLLRSR